MPCANATRLRCASQNRSGEGRRVTPNPYWTLERSVKNICEPFPVASVELDMKIHRQTFIAITGLCFLAHGAFAVKMPTPKAEMEKGSTHILVGTVSRIYSTSERVGQFQETRYVAEILVKKIEKGDGLKVGEVVLVRYFWQDWRGRGTPPTGDPGHRPTPKKGDPVRVFLVNIGYNGAGTTTDGGFDVYYYEGFEILPVAPPKQP